jgi:hypothetical protein
MMSLIFSTLIVLKLGFWEGDLDSLLMDVTQPSKYGVVNMTFIYKEEANYISPRGAKRLAIREAIVPVAIRGASFRLFILRLP